MDRYFMLRSGSSGTCYCGKCGKKQLRDRYNMRKHAQECGFDMKEEVLLLEEGKDLGYRLEDTPEGLTLNICTPRLCPIPGFTDRFSGTFWQPVFEVDFPVSSKCPEVYRNETGMEMDMLLALIRAGRIYRIRCESDAEIIRRVYPSVVDVHSLQMFAHIYKNKGYSTRSALRRGLEEKLFEMLPPESVWSPAQEGIEDRRRKETPLCVTLYNYRKDTFILQVVMNREGEKTVFLFTRGYSVCSREVDLDEVLKYSFRLVGGYDNAIRRFDQACPEYHLRQFCKQSSNILLPLLAADYHSGMELAAKSGLAAIAENYDRISALNLNPGLYRNLKELFGLPMSVLRSLRGSQACDAVLDRFRQIYAYNPVFLQFEAYTESMIDFYMLADVTHSGAANMIEGTNDLQDRQILQILRYLEKNPRDGHYYCDYLRACAQLGEFPYGITPAIPIREAHDYAFSRVRNHHDRSVKRAFEEAVGREEYRSIATCFAQEDEERFREDKYIVVTPGSSDDLFKESENMHNCVQLYVQRVAYGQTRIYFLRRKEEPEKSFGTLEITKDGTKLCQAKAFANKKLPVDAQRFLIKWCRAKHIRVATYDLNKVS